MKIAFKILWILVILVLNSLFLSHCALEFAGIEMLLAGVILVMLIEGIVAFELRYKWLGLVYHLLCATIFYLVYSSKYAVFDGWQWYLLWGILAVRLLVLQPVYLIKIKRKSN